MKYTAPRCAGFTKQGNPCKNRIIDGDKCWLHDNREVDLDPRHIVIVKCFKCPHCGKLTEI